MTRLTILDTDGGVDDAQALLMLIAAGRAPDLVTTTFGNVPLREATQNILSVLSMAGRGDIPVHAGARRPMIQAPLDATHIHGADGLGGAPRPAVILPPASDDGVGVLVQTLSAAAREGEKVDLLMIGPLTNLAMALRLAPDCAAGVGQVTIMGGTLHGRGNITPAAEFNIFADPEAAAIVFATDIDILVVPWETCAAHRLTGAEVDAIFADVPDGPVKSFSLALANHARATIAGFGGGDHFRFVDPLAAAVVIDPAIVTRYLHASVDVALAPGLTRGMTVVDPTGRLGTSRRRLVEAVDPDLLVDLYKASIADPAPQEQPT